MRSFRHDNSRNFGECQNETCRLLESVLNWVHFSPNYLPGLGGYPICDGEMRGEMGPNWAGWRWGGKGSEEGALCCLSSSTVQLCFGNSSFTVVVV